MKTKRKTVAFGIYVLLIFWPMYALGAMFQGAKEAFECGQKGFLDWVQGVIEND